MEERWAELPARGRASKESVLGEMDTPVGVEGGRREAWGLVGSIVRAVAVPRAR